jgi:hypothetical protein
MRTRTPGPEATQSTTLSVSKRLCAPSSDSDTNHAIAANQIYVYAWLHQCALLWLQDRDA